MLQLKKELFETCKQILIKKMDECKASMEEAQSAANSEKGMMGDKFESFREQMQIERDRHAERFVKASNELQNFLKINVVTKNEIVCTGSLFQTETTFYFIACSIGKVKIEGNEILCISNQTPLYQAMKGKKVGDSFQFNETNSKIISIT